MSESPSAARWSAPYVLRIVLAIVLMPLVLPLLVLAALATVPCIFFAFSLQLIGLNEEGAWVIDHSPMALLLDGIS